MVVSRLLLLAGLLTAGCSTPNLYQEDRPSIAYPIMNSTKEFGNGGIIDHTINELRQMNQQNNQSIAPNDADKVYNQRFIEDLERKRDKSRQQ